MSAQPLDDANTPARGGRRCVRRPLAAGSPRPSEPLRLFFLAGLAWMVGAAPAAVASALGAGDSLRWLALHMLLLGGVSQLVLGAAQFFVCAFLATDPPPRALLAAQLSTWNVGTALVAAGDPSGRMGPLEAGAALAATGLALFLAALARMQRRSLQRAPWALRWYRASVAALGLGALLGVLMSRGMAWPHGSLLGAHLALGLAGWLGTAIVGTLHTFFPSLTHTRLRYPRLQAPTFALWLLGVGELAGGAAWGSDPLVAAAWVDLITAATLLCLNLFASLRAAPRPLALPARLLALAQAFLAAGLIVALAATVAGGAGAPFDGPARDALAVLLLAGWIGLTVSGSLLHLLAILARIRRFARPMPVPRPARDRVLTGAAGAAVGLLALAQAPGLGALAGPAAVALAAVAAIVAARVLALALQAVGSIAPRRTR